jgi:hypothetical protein
MGKARSMFGLNEERWKLSMGFGRLEGSSLPKWLEELT